MLNTTDLDFFLISIWLHIFLLPESWSDVGLKSRRKSCIKIKSIKIDILSILTPNLNQSTLHLTWLHGWWFYSDQYWYPWNTPHTQEYFHLLRLSIHLGMFHKISMCENKKIIKFKDLVLGLKILWRLLFKFKL